jgi:hypothetical protein
MKWLNRIFGFCSEQSFFHQWKYDNLSERRRCENCGRVQRKVGEYQLDMDLEKIPQWKDEIT